jgi:hypothetical protein
MAIFNYGDNIYFSLCLLFVLSLYTSIPTALYFSMKKIGGGAIYCIQLSIIRYNFFLEIKTSTT